MQDAITPERLVQQEELFRECYEKADIYLGRSLYHPDLVYVSPTFRIIDRPSWVMTGIEAGLDFIQATLGGIDNIGYQAVSTAIATDGRAALRRLSAASTTRRQRPGSQPEGLGPRGRGRDGQGTRGVRPDPLRLGRGGQRAGALQLCLALSLSRGRPNRAAGDLLRSERCAVPSGRSDLIIQSPAPAPSLRESCCAQAITPSLRSRAISCSARPSSPRISASCSASRGARRDRRHGDFSSR